MVEAYRFLWGKLKQPAFPHYLTFPGLDCYFSWSSFASGCSKDTGAEEGCFSGVVLGVGCRRFLVDFDDGLSPASRPYGLNGMLIPGLIQCIMTRWVPCLAVGYLRALNRQAVVTGLILDET